MGNGELVIGNGELGIGNWELGMGIRYRLLVIVNWMELTNSLCPMPYALFPIPYALCPMPYALFPIPLIINHRQNRLMINNPPRRSANILINHISLLIFPNSTEFVLLSYSTIR